MPRGFPCPVGPSLSTLSAGAAASVTRHAQGGLSTHLPSPQCRRAPLTRLCDPFSVWREVAVRTRPRDPCPSPSWSVCANSRTRWGGVRPAWPSQGVERTTRGALQPCLLDCTPYLEHGRRGLLVGHPGFSVQCLPGDLPIQASMGRPGWQLAVLAAAGLSEPPTLGSGS